MILILSQHVDPATNNVCRWLNFLNAKWARLNSLKHDSTEIDIKLSNESESIRIITSNEEIASEKINTVWYRRSPLGYVRADLNLNLKELPSLLKEPLVIHLAGEKACLFRAVASQFKHCFWLNGLESPDKYYQLKCARLAGLKIPDTFIVSNKKKLTELVHQFGEVITKPLTEVLNFSFQGQIYMSYTQMIDENSLASIPEFFHNSLVQRNIKKRYELRVFYFDSKFFSMVMFSQNEHQTSIDFRRYDFTNPTRWVPYKLPFQIEEKLDKLMRTLHLNSGSIDLIYGADLEYYFLEVNPVGQYAMVSDACNYYLDKLICDFLIKQNERQQQF